MGLFGANQYDGGPRVWELKTAQYAAAHREVWHRGVQFFIFYLDVLIVCALGYVFVTYVAGIPQHKALEDSLNTTYVTFQAYRAVHRTLPVEIVEVAVVPTSAGRGDMVALLRNPNREWAAREVPYQFVGDGVRTVRQATALLPGETRVIAAFSQTVQLGGTVRVELGTVAWRNIDPSRMPRLEGFAADTFRYTPFERGGTGLDFTAYNRTPYSFWSVPAMVVARDAGRIVGVHQVAITQWASGQTRAVALSWPEVLPRVTETAVDFAVDALNPASLMPLSGETAPYPGF